MYEYVIVRECVYVCVCVNVSVYEVTMGFFVVAD